MMDEEEEEEEERTSFLQLQAEAEEVKVAPFEVALESGSRYKHICTLNLFVFLLWL